MSKKPSKSDWVDATLALALAAGGGLLVLLSVLTLRGGGVSTGDGVLPVLARAMIGNFGLIPGLLAGLVMAGVGSWMFLANRYEGVVRHLAGALCTVAGLAVLLGALSEDAGGRFGALLGGTASSIVTKPGGALFGLLFLLAPVWFFWFRERIDLSSFLKSAPRSAADSDAHDAGVSVAEAEALAPVMSAGQSAPELSNPYPEDVRLKGALPAGTLPLESDEPVLLTDAPHDASSDHADLPYAASVNRWTPQRDEPADESVDDDLAAAGVADADELVEEEFEGDELGEVRPLETAGDAADPFAEHRFEPEVHAVEAAVEVAEDVEPTEEVDAGPIKLTAAYQPPRPSWEVDNDEDLVAEAVPIEVSDALEQVEDEDLEEDELLEDPDEEELEDSYAAADLDEEEDEDEEELEEDEELEETLAADDSDEDEDDEEEEYEEEEELEETLAADDSEEDEDEEEEYEDEEELEETLAADDSDEDEDDEEEEYEEEEELEETLAADDSDEDEEEEYEEEEEPEEELEETLAADDSEEDEEEGYEEAEEELEADEPETVLEPAAAAAAEAAEAAAAAEVQMDLFDEPAAPQAAEPVAVADSGDSEPEVVLAPQVAVGDGARKISAQLLTDAGNLLVTEQRVAVSMLQKRFALDFDQSCVILDELQQLGLIGPFVDGAPRDILMSSEEWLEMTGQS